MGVNSSFSVDSSQQVLSIGERTGRSTSTTYERLARGF